MRNLTKYNEDLSIPRKKDVDERSTATNLENGTGAGALKQTGAAAASGANATAFGSGTSASAANAHAEGNGAVASGSASHAQNSGTKASGDYSHAEGSLTEASGQAAHAEGTGTVAANRSQHVEGEYNVQDPSGNEPSGRGTYQHIVGNGTSDTDRSNAHTMDWNGNAWYAGDVYVGSTSGTGMDNGSKKLATEEFVTSDYLQKTGDSSETTTTFEQAAARENVASGDKISVLFGKIAKWFSDLKTVAFSGKSSDLDNDAKFQTENDLNTALAKKQDTLITSSAKAGDMIKVKSVSDDGVPTAYGIAEEGTDYLKSSHTLTVTVTGSTADKTFAEIKAAYDAGYVIQCSVPASNLICNLALLTTSPEALWFTSSNGYTIIQRVTYSNGSWSVNNEYLVPADRTINDKSLATNVTLDASDIGALPLTGGTMDAEAVIDMNGGGINMSRGVIENVLQLGFAVNTREFEEPVVLNWDYDKTNNLAHGYFTNDYGVVASMELYTPDDATGETVANAGFVKKQITEALENKQDTLISSGAAAGNLIKIKTVNSSGKPTAWEVAEAGTDYAPSVMFVEVTGSSGSYETITYPQAIFAIGRGKRSVFMCSDEDSMFYPLIASTQTQACFGGLDADGNAVRYIINSDRTAEKHLTSIGGKTYPVTLTADGWDAFMQTVSFSAANSKETDHLLIPTPASSDLVAYNDAGILCIEEDGTNQTLTFHCETVPTVDIVVYVTVQSVNYQG